MCKYDALYSVTIRRGSARRRAGAGAAGSLHNGYGDNNQQMFTEHNRLTI